MCITTTYITYLLAPADVNLSDYNDMVNQSELIQHVFCYERICHGFLGTM